jgi:hypothetical protein
MMNCYTHQGRAAVGVCTACGKAVCRECVGADAPRLVCSTCMGQAGTAPIVWSPRSYGVGWEFRSAISIGSWPLVHICFGNDPVTLRPRIAKGVIAIGNAAVGALAVGGAAFGLLTIGGFSLGLAGALGGFALGVARLHVRDRRWRDGAGGALRKPLRPGRARLPTPVDRPSAARMQMRTSGNWLIGELVNRGIG